MLEEILSNKTEKEAGPGGHSWAATESHVAGHVISHRKCWDECGEEMGFSRVWTSWSQFCSKICKIDQRNMVT